MIAAGDIGMMSGKVREKGLVTACLPARLAVLNRRLGGGSGHRVGDFDLEVDRSDAGVGRERRSSSALRALARWGGWGEHSGEGVAGDDERGGLHCVAGSMGDVVVDDVYR